MASDESTGCPICESSSARRSMRNAITAVIHVECPLCGEFEIAWTTAIELSLSQRERAAVSGFLRHEQVRGAQMVSLASDSTPAHGRRVVGVSDAVAARPRRVGEIQDALLGALASLVEQPGGNVRLTAQHSPLVYSFDRKDLDWHMGELAARGFVRLVQGSDTYQLTHRGWTQVDDLERGLTPIPDQGFVAMWFDPSMDPVYENAIKPAIEAAGFQPFRIKDVEHNNKICDEILAEIRRSRFVVAEFTGNRGGVYFEAGFAMGLGIPVVWVVRESDLPSVHFDTNHFNHVTWATEDELRTKLERRVAATIPRPAPR